MKDMAEIQYEDEYLTTDACKVYGVEFAELMENVRLGRIRARSRMNSRGSEVYMFRRGDVAEYAKEVSRDM